MTLREAIEQQINLGTKEPREIAKAVRRHVDDEWLAGELLANADDIIAEISRGLVAASRRSSLSLTKIEATPKRELMLEAAYLPGVGWVEFGHFTVEHFDKLATTYRRGAAALNRYAEWCESSAALMREQDVKEFRQVRGPLPELPPAEAA